MPVYRCPKCGRTVKKPEGTYYCKVCGRETIMEKIAKVSSEELAKPAVKERTHILVNGQLIVTLREGLEAPRDFWFALSILPYVKKRKTEEGEIFEVQLPK